MAVTTNFSFTKLVGTDYAGYSTINVLIDSIDSILNTKVGISSIAAPVSTATNLTVATTSKSIICTAVAVLTLPAPATYTGRELLIKNTTAATVTSVSSNVVPLTGGAAGTAILAATAGKWALLVSDGTNWIIMASN